MVEKLKQFVEKAGIDAGELVTRLFEVQPEAPAEGYRDAVEIESPGRLGAALVVICGVENFAVVEQVIERSNSNTIVIAEPEPARVRHLAENWQLPFSLASRDIRWVVGEAVDSLGDEIEKHLSLAAVPDVCTVPPVSSRSSEFEQALRNLANFKQVSRNNLATVDRFLVDWCVYFAGNLSRYLSASPLDELHGALEDQPCILLGPGPSLEANLELLRSFESGWSVALDTALPTLVELDFSPDFVVSVDVGEDNLEYLSDIPSETTLVTPPYMPPKIFERAGNFYLFEPNFPAARWLKPEFDPPGYLGQSGSVGVTALDFVKLLKPSSCHLIGVDLSYPGGLAFSRLSPRYSELVDQLDRFTTLPGLQLEKINEKEARLEKADGREILTSAEFLNWRRYFEFLLANMDFPVYRPEGEALPLDGTETPPPGGPPEGFSDKQLRKKAISSETDWSALNSKLETLLGDLMELESRLRVISSLHRRNSGKFESEWLQFTRELSGKDSVTGYFHWSVDRLSRELRSAEEDGRDLFSRQYKRWDRLISSTAGALRDWLGKN